jgi:hypothetical protein
VSKDGKEGFLGKINHKLKNVERYFVNTWSENFSQNSIDIILGKHAKSFSREKELQTFLSAEMKKREDLYSEIKNLRLFVGTWNLGGFPAPIDSERPDHQISKWLFPFQQNMSADILVIGFQEIVELNPKQVLLGGNSEAIEQWN